MGLTAVQDVARATALGLSLREAVRHVAQRALTEAAGGTTHSSAYLREIHRLMVATA